MKNKIDKILLTPYSTIGSQAGMMLLLVICVFMVLSYGLMAINPEVTMPVLFATLYTMPTALYIYVGAFIGTRLYLYVAGYVKRTIDMTNHGHTINYESRQNVRECIGTILTVSYIPITNTLLLASLLLVPIVLIVSTTAGMATKYICVAIATSVNYVIDKERNLLDL